MILITGGAGYIGSHTLRSLLNSGVPSSGIIVLDVLEGVDNLISVPEGVQFIEASCGDIDLLKELFSDHDFESVFHFAAHHRVDESVRVPEKYYFNNFDGSAALIEVCYATGVSNFVFSSSCAAIGSPKSLPVDELAATHPESPYGRSKLMVEWFLADKLESARLSSTHAMNYAALRYFNVAGAHVAGGLGPQDSQQGKLVFELTRAIVAKSDRKFKIFGTDYPTADGTCIRDYIHVDDLADAHVLALNFLKKEKRSEIFNLGYGHGYSVREIIDTMKRVSGVDFPVEEAPRRAGDAEAIYADNTKARKLLGWTPKYDNIELICKTALDWERELSKKSVH